MRIYERGQSSREPSYLPTPEDIRAACAEIQAGWTPFERRMRRAGCDGRGKPIIPMMGNRKGRANKAA